MDEATRQAVIAAAEAAGVRPDRAELVARLVPPVALSRSVTGELDSYLLEVAVRGAAQMAPEWFQDPPAPDPRTGAAAGSPTAASAAGAPAAGPQPQDVDRVIAHMRFACGFIDVPAKARP